MLKHDEVLQLADLLEKVADEAPDINVSDLDRANEAVAAWRAIEGLNKVAAGAGTPPVSVAQAPAAMVAPPPQAKMQPGGSPGKSIFGTKALSTPLTTQPGGLSASAAAVKSQSTLKTASEKIDSKAFASALPGLAKTALIGELAGMAAGAPAGALGAAGLGALGYGAYKAYKKLPGALSRAGESLTKAFKPRAVGGAEVEAQEALGRLAREKGWSKPIPNVKNLMREGAEEASSISPLATAAGVGGAGIVGAEVLRRKDKKPQIEVQKIGHLVRRRIGLAKLASFRGLTKQSELDKEAIRPIIAGGLNLARRLGGILGLTARSGQKALFARGQAISRSMAGGQAGRRTQFMQGEIGGRIPQGARRRAGLAAGEPVTVGGKRYRRAAATPAPAVGTLPATGPIAQRGGRSASQALVESTGPIKSRLPSSATARRGVLSPGRTSVRQAREASIETAASRGNRPAAVPSGPFAKSQVEAMEQVARGGVPTTRSVRSAVKAAPGSYGTRIAQGGASAGPAGGVAMAKGVPAVPAGRSARAMEAGTNIRSMQPSITEGRIPGMAAPKPPAAAKTAPAKPAGQTIEPEAPPAAKDEGFFDQAKEWWKKAPMEEKAIVGLGGAYLGGKALESQKQPVQVTKF